MAESKTLTPETYYKLKSTLLEFALRRQTIEQAIREAQNAAIVAAGLDPNVTYSLDDTILAATPVEAVPEQGKEIK